MRNSGEARTAVITTGDGDGDGDGDGNAAKDILDFVAQASDDWRELERLFSAEDLVQARDKHGSTLFTMPQVPAPWKPVDFCSPGP